MTHATMEDKEITDESVLARMRLEVNNFTLRLKVKTAMCNAYQAERSDYIHCGFWKNPIDAKHADELATCLASVKKGLI